MAIKPEEIKKPKLLFVEGKDEVHVFEELLRHIGIDDVQVMQSGGNIQFKNLFPAIVKSPGFSGVYSYGIVQDADNEWKSSFERIQGTLKSAGQPVPSKPTVFVEKDETRVGVFLMPGGDENGMLEDLYLRSLAGTPVLASVERFIADLQLHCSSTGKRGEFLPPTNIAKAKALGTLVATEGPLNQLGVASKAGYWDFSHRSMTGIIEFIRQI